MLLSTYCPSAGLLWGLSLVLSCASVSGVSSVPAEPMSSARSSSGLGAVLNSTAAGSGPQATRVWRVTPARVGDQTPGVVGQPQALLTPFGPATCFDGKEDGLVVEDNPISGWQEFTLQVLFRPDAGGPAEQRFVHVQEAVTDNRAMVETRVTPEGAWYLDSFLRSSDDKLALIDPQQQHPADRWYWAALTYDGETMRHYVSAQLEGEGKVRFQPLGAGSTSLGMRLNQVHWFQGCIAEVRYDSRALLPRQLQVLTAADRPHAP